MFTLLLTDDYTHQKSVDTPVNGGPLENSLDPAEVHNGLQSLSLSDQTGAVGNHVGYIPRVEEWVRQTAKTALPLDSVNAPGSDPPRDISSPTFTDNSLNYSQMVRT